MNKIARASAIKVPSLAPRSSIALLCESTELGGGERVVSHLGRGFMARGYSVHLIVPTKVAGGWLDSTLRSHGAVIHHVPLHTHELPAGIRAIRRVLTDERISVANAHMPGMVVLGSVAARLAGVPMLATLHNGNERWDLVKRRIPLAIAMRLSSSVNVVSGAMRDDVARQTWQKPDSISLIYNGAEAAVGARDVVRARLGIAAGRTMVLCLGSKTANKDHATAVRALRLARHSESMTLVIAGRDGDGSAALRDAIAETSAHIVVLEHTDDVAGLLAASDVFVLTSLREGLPMVIVEAMLASKPVISTRVGGIPEVIEDGVSGLFYHPGDSTALAELLDRLSTSSQLRDSLAYEARRRAQSGLTIDCMVEAYLEHLAKIGGSDV